MLHVLHAHAQFSHCVSVANHFWENIRLKCLWWPLDNVRISVCSEAVYCCYRSNLYRVAVFTECCHLHLLQQSVFTVSLIIKTRTATPAPTYWFFSRNLVTTMWKWPFWEKKSGKKEQKLTNTWNDVKKVNRFTTFLINDCICLINFLMPKQSLRNFSTMNISNKV